MVEKAKESRGHHSASLFEANHMAPKILPVSSYCWYASPELHVEETGAPSGFYSGAGRSTLIRLLDGLLSIPVRGPCLHQGKGVCQDTQLAGNRSFSFFSLFLPAARLSSPLLSEHPRRERRIITRPGLRE